MIENKNLMFTMWLAGIRKKKDVDILEECKKLKLTPDLVNTFAQKNLEGKIDMIFDMVSK
jgi:hypothetical protein